jgi:hypothetical protein
MRWVLNHTYRIVRRRVMRVAWMCYFVCNVRYHRACKTNWLSWVKNQAFAAFPSMSIGQEDLAAILFVIAIVGIRATQPLPAIP